MWCCRLLCSGWGDKGVLEGHFEHLMEKLERISHRPSNKIHNAKYLSKTPIHKSKIIMTRLQWQLINIFKKTYLKTKELFKTDLFRPIESQKPWLHQVKLVTVCSIAWHYFAFWRTYWTMAKLIQKYISPTKFEALLLNYFLHFTFFSKFPMFWGEWGLGLRVVLNKPLAN